MPTKKRGAKIVFLEPRFNDILIHQKSAFQPFIEVFIQEGENVAQKNLGTLFGVLEITDLSEDSSYVVNYIISVIKKEFFSKEKRGAIESMEAALHKANLALSKLAQHENISWIGNFNALVATIEKNNLHFSQAGKASALLIRNKTLTDISEGMSEGETPNPLKTFTNISSGKLEKNDKLILATPEIFDIFSLEEIKKAAIRFSKEKFSQFFKTALSNEIERAAVLISDIEERTKLETPKSNLSEQEEIPNAFSQKAFYKEKKKKKETEKTSREDLKKIVQEEAKSKKKDGHIYIKEDLAEISGRKASLEDNTFDFRDKLDGFWEKTKEMSGGKLRTVRTKKANRKNKSEYSLGENISSSAKKISGQIITVLKNIPWQELFQKFSKVMRKALVGLINFSKKIIVWFNLLTKKQKIYVLSGLLIIIILFFTLLTWNRNDSQQTIPQENSATDPDQTTSQENSPENNPSASQAFVREVKNFSENPLAITKVNDKIFAVFNDGIINLTEEEKTNFPDNFGVPEKTAGMNDLDFLFFSNSENQIISFSPTNKKFETNSIEFPEGTKINSLGTFLTYLYIFDSEKGKIYRYPRAEGGFGERFDWLKDDLDLNGLEKMTVSESIFLSGKEKIIKLTKGVSEQFSFDLGTWKISSVDDFTLNDNQTFTLDKNEGKITITDLSGNIQQEIQKEELIGASQIIATEESNKLLFLKDSKIFKLTF